MAGVNKVILIGNLGKDPEVRYLENGKAVANVTLATTERYKDREGNQIENTEWHDLEMWDGLAKVAEQYLQKGKSIYVEGRIKTDSWQDEQGNKKYRTRIRVQNMTMLGSAANAGQGGNAYAAPSSAPMQSSTPPPAQAAPSPAPAPAPEDNSIDDLPF